MTANGFVYQKRQERSGRRKTGSTKSVEYWGLTAVVGRGNVKVRVVLKRVGTGNIIFGA
jgi:hypothetical protein